MSTSIDAHRDSATTLLQDVSALREHVLQVVQRVSAEGSSCPIADDLLATLQAASSEVASAEAALGSAATRATPAHVSAVPAPGAGGRRDPRWSAEAASIVAFAHFSLPYARSKAAAAELWMRALRRHGAVGDALGSLGYPDGQLLPRAEPGPRRSGGVEGVRSGAVAFADERRAATVTSADLLFAVIEIYGTLVDRALYEHGVTRQQLIDRLAGTATVEQDGRPAAS